MANLITKNNQNYFKSKDIKVFPSSFRGTYKTGTNPTDPEVSFDPESRLNTEATAILSKTTLGKTTYIVNYADNKVAFVLGGYYFELSDVSSYLEEIKNKYIGIRLRTITLQDSTKVNVNYRADTTRQTSLLDSWEENSDNILDHAVDANSTTNYYFTGLRVFNSDTEATNSGVPIIKLFNSNKTLNQTYCLPTITQGTGQHTLMHGESLRAGGQYQTVFGRYNSNNTANLFEVGKGTLESNRSNALSVSATKTTINTDTDISGDTKVTGNVTITGKATSALTVSSDPANTLITKSYVDNVVGGIGTGNTGGGGEGTYIKSISQNGATVRSESQAFDSSITENNSNAPTSKAVKDFVISTIDELYAAEVGGDSTYIQKISEANGKISATIKAFSSVINATNKSDDTAAPSVKAVYDYIETIRTRIEDKVSTDIGSAVGDLKISGTVGTDGSYLKSINQTDGKITPTTQNFDTQITTTATNNNAPTTRAVKDYTDTVVSDIWTKDLVKVTTTAGLDSLKDIILNAVYPVGAVYIHYVSSTGAALTECPIKTQLGGTWTAIDAKTFLMATDDASRGSTGGSNDAITVSHTHTAKTDTKTPNVVVDDLKKSGSFTIRDMNHDGVGPMLGTDGIVTREDVSFSDKKEKIDGTGSGKGGHEKLTITIDHSHTAYQDAHSHTVTCDSAGEDGVGKNMPQYLAVYMWRRTA